MNEVYIYYEDHQPIPGGHCRVVIQGVDCSENAIFPDYKCTLLRIKIHSHPTLWWLNDAFLGLVMIPL